jgi:hypothetical protein
MKMDTMTPMGRILLIALHSPQVRAEILKMLLLSFEDWQTTDLSCAPKYAAVDWFAIAEIEQDPPYSHHDYSI